MISAARKLIIKLLFAGGHKNYSYCTGAQIDDEAINQAGQY